MKAVFFVSRNKDNKDVDGFKERKKTFIFSNPTKDNLRKKFYEFVSEGRYRELYRCYISVNERDEDKTRKALMHALIDENINLVNIQSKLVSLSMRPENAKEHKWLFDVDMPLDEFTKHLKFEYQTVSTLNNYSVIVTHGFDTRELLEKFKGKVELKRDGMQMLMFGRG